MPTQQIPVRGSWGTVADPSQSVTGPRPSAGQRQTPRKKWATPKEWTERIRMEVTRLYIHEDRTLREVMEIMAKDFGHHGTRKMYLMRISSWGLVKNKKEDDMTFMSLKRAQRKAIGKGTTFLAHGRPVNEKAFYYFFRKGYNPAVGVCPPTPPHIVYRTPSPPPALRVPEELFYSIQTYCDGSFQSGDWITADNGICYNVKVGGSKEDVHDRFYSACVAASGFIVTKDYVEARRMLSTGCALVRGILEAQDPAGAGRLLCTLESLLIRDMPELVKLIRDYISAMADVVISRNHPWAVIWRSIARLDMGTDGFGDALTQSVKCIAAAFSRNLGKYHTNTIDWVMQSITLFHRNGDHKAEELEIRKLLLECKEHFQDTNKDCCGILWELAACIRAQKRYSEQELIGKELIEAGRKLEATMVEARGYALLFSAQHSQQKFTEAEQSIRKLISVIELALGHASPWVIDHMKKLESWLRDWGRDFDAVRNPSDIFEFGKIREAQRVFRVFREFPDTLSAPYVLGEPLLTFSKDVVRDDIQKRLEQHALDDEIEVV